MTMSGDTSKAIGKRFAIVTVLLVVIAGLATAAALVMVDRGNDEVAGTTEYVVMDSPRAQPVFEPAGSPGSDSFYPLDLQLTSFQRRVQNDAEQQALALTQDADEDEVIDSEQLPEFDVAALEAEAKTGIFGGSAENTCDPERLISFLYANPDIGEAWAQVQGLEFSEIAPYIRSLEVRVLAEDAAVLNHGFDVTSGAAYELDSVLAAGTAVLVDEDGDIRTRCFCGNPIRPRPEPAPQPPRCLIVGTMVFVEPAGTDRRTGLSSPTNVLLTGRETTIGGQVWVEISLGADTNNTGWTLRSNLRKHYCPPPTNYDYDCPGEGLVNTWADPERTIKVGEVTGTVNTATGPESIFAPISPVGGPGGEVLFNDSLLIRFTQAFPSVQNSAWVHIDDLNNNDCNRIAVCITSDGPVFDRMNGAVIAAQLTTESVEFTGHFANDPISQAEIRLFDGAGTTGWITDNYTAHAGEECREAPETPILDCAKGTWDVWATADTLDPFDKIGLLENTEVLLLANPAENGRKLVQMGVPGSSVGPTGWVDQNAFLDGNNHCEPVSVCASTLGSAWSEFPDAGNEIPAFTKVEGVTLHGQWAITAPMNAHTIVEVGGASGWISVFALDVHGAVGECDPPPPPSSECVTYQVPDPSNGQDPYPYDDVSLAFSITLPEDDGETPDDNNPGGNASEQGLCCIEGGLFFEAGGLMHADIMGSLWVDVTGATQEVDGQTWFETAEGFWFSENQIVDASRCQPECPVIDFIQIAARYFPGEDGDVPELPDPVTPPEGCCVNSLYFDNNFAAPQADVALGVPVEVIGGPVFADGAEWYLTADGMWFPLSARTFDSDCTDVKCPVPEILLSIVFDGEPAQTPDPTGCCISGWADSPGGDIQSPAVSERAQLSGDRVFAAGEAWLETVDGRWVPESAFRYTSDCDVDIDDPTCPGASLIADAPLAAGTLCCVQGTLFNEIGDGLRREVDTATPMSTDHPVFVDGNPWFPVTFEGESYFTFGGMFVDASECDPEPEPQPEPLPTVAPQPTAVPRPTVAPQPTVVPQPDPVPVPCQNSDQDSHCDDDDNCDFNTNEDQRDSNNNGIGDVCDQCPDADQDQVCDSDDTCPNQVNIGDSDQDGTDDACDNCIDADRDFACDNVDNCVGVPNIDQTDSDGDGAGDLCDGTDDRCPTSSLAGTGECCATGQAATSDGCFEFCPDGSVDFGQGCGPCALTGDGDSDGICDDADTCPNDPSNLDTDGDGFCNTRDTCPLLPDFSTTFVNSYIDQDGVLVQNCDELI